MTWLVVSSVLSPLFAVAPTVVPIEPLDFKPAKAERVVLKNGVVVFLKEDHELPLFDVQMWIHVSPADEPVPDTFNFFGAVWRTGGTTSRSPEKLNQELEWTPASIETSANDEELAMSLSCLSKDMDKSLGIFADILLHPAFNDDQITLQRSKMMEELLRKNETPTKIARRAFRDVTYGNDHVYSYASSEASLKKVSRTHLLALYKQAVVPDQTVMAVSGDFKKDELIATLERLFGSWKPSGRTVPAYDYSCEKPVSRAAYFSSRKIRRSRASRLRAWAHRGTRRIISR